MRSSIHSTYSASTSVDAKTKKTPEIRAFKSSEHSVVGPDWSAREKKNQKATRQEQKSGNELKTNKNQSVRVDMTDLRKKEMPSGRKSPPERENKVTIND